MNLGEYFSTEKPTIIQILDNANVWCPINLDWFSHSKSYE